MDNKQILGALALDLKRAALGFYRKSYTTADRFLAEACARRKEVNITQLSPYMQEILNDIDSLHNEEYSQRAENALLYSTRILNYVLKK